MTHRYFRHPKPGLIELPGHFHADDTARGLELHDIKDLLSNQAEVAVHIANRQCKSETHGPAICGADQNAIPGVGSLYFVAVDEIDIGAHLSQEVVDLTNIVLSVTIGVEDQFLLRIRETRDERGAISAIPRVVNRANERQFRREPVRDHASLVLASIIN